MLPGFLEYRWLDTQTLHVHFAGTKYVNVPALSHLTYNIEDTANVQGRGNRLQACRSTRAFLLVHLWAFIS
jgi:hypothetical protein